MSKRKQSSLSAGVVLSSSPTQSHLTSFLSSTKPTKRPKKEGAGPGSLLGKRTTTKTPPSVEKCQSPDAECESLVGGCESTGLTPGEGTRDLGSVLKMIDEVISFAGRGVLWSHIQEEVYSLHKRYHPRPVVSCPSLPLTRSLRACAFVFCELFVSFGG